MIRAFVAGHPVAHSRSPLIHTHWLNEHGIAGSYEPIEIEPGALAGLIARIEAGEFAGGNVTLPHKEAAFALSEIGDEETRRIGAVNTLVAVPGAGHVRGTNTDLYGFIANLDAGAPGWAPQGSGAIVLGAGGAARAVIVALLSRGFARIAILNRTVERAEALAREFAGMAGRATLSGAGLDRFAGLAPRADLIVNTSSVGMGGTGFEGLDLWTLPERAVVTDIVYAPLVTPLLAAASARGLRTVDGLGMLLHQAVPGFEAWFGARPAVTPALRALIEETLT